MENQELIPVTVFCTHHHIEASFLRSLQEYGLISLTYDNGNDFLDAEEVNMIERLMRLHYDLQVNFEGLDVIHNLLQQQHDLQAQLDSLRSKVRFYEVTD